MMTMYWSSLGPAEYPIKVQPKSFSRYAVEYAVITFAAFVFVVLMLGGFLYALEDRAESEISKNQSLMERHQMLRSKGPEVYRLVDSRRGYE